MDKTSKVIFALIAAGLWFNAAANLLRPAYAQPRSDLASMNDIKTSVEIIARSIDELATGICRNRRLCQ